MELARRAPSPPCHGMPRMKTPLPGAVNQGNQQLQPVRPLLVPAAAWELEEGSQPASALRWGIEPREGDAPGARAASTCLWGSGQAQQKVSSTTGFTASRRHAGSSGE